MKEKLVLSLVMLAVNGGYLFAGGDSTGVCRRPLSEMTTSMEESPVELPAEYSLSQNFPNPFNPTTLIRYQVPGVSEVKLVVYDFLGREVSVLENGRREAGAHEVKFDGTGLASGVYFYRLQARHTDGAQAGTYMQTRKLLLLR